MKVAVVGSGVAGTSTAFALAAAGVNVTVIDSERDGRASAAGAGIIQPWSSGATGPFYDLYAAGAAYYPRVSELLAAAGVADVGYRRSGSIVVDSDPGQLADIEKRLRERTMDVPLAGEIERLDATQARELFPPLAPELAALLVPGGARVDGRRLCAGLLQAAQRHGARVVEAVARLELDGGTPQLHSGADRVAADAIVIAAGAWSNHLIEPLGVQVPVEPQRGQITHLQLRDTETKDWPSVLPPASHYLVTFDGGRIAVGATRETGSGFDPRVTAAGQCQVLADALRVAPGLADATVLETRVGLRPLAEIPVIGALDEYPNVYLNTGFGAAGLTMGPLVGHLLAQLILGDQPDVDLAGFAPSDR
jgi:D-amino-acid dehydrogenase